MKQIPLTQGKVALVDDDDFEWLNQFKWYPKKGRKTFYAVTSIYNRETQKSKNVKMNRLLLNITDPNILVDHIDHNGLNNQRSNLRLANHSQNGANACLKKKKITKHLGVSWHKQAGKWEVHIKKNYKDYYLGLFSNESDAALAYNLKAKELHGEFANLNVI